MTEIKKLQKAAHGAILLLRKQKHSQGLPFMINSDILPSSQCLLEFPDGIIKIVEADTLNTGFRIVHEFTKKESNNLRKRFGLKPPSKL